MLKNNNNSKAELVILNLSKKKEDSPFFQVSRKNEEDGKFAQTEERATSVSGVLGKIEFPRSSWDDVPYTKVKVFLKDSENNELYLLDASFNAATRGLLNSIANLPSNDPVELSIWKNKNGFTNISVYQNGEKVGWKHDYDKLPQPEETVFKGQTLKDTSKMDEFLEKEVIEWREKFPYVAPQGSTNENDNEDSPQQEVEDDDVPF